MNAHHYRHYAEVFTSHNNIRKCVSDSSVLCSLNDEPCSSNRGVIKSRNHDFFFGQANDTEMFHHQQFGGGGSDNSGIQSGSSNFHHNNILVDGEQQQLSTSPAEFAGQNSGSFAAATDDDGKKKRPRTAFTAAQIKALESEFEKCKYLSVTKRVELSRKLGLTQQQLKVWYQNRRTKWKRKYAQDVESVAKQYYSSLGLNTSLRPMFIGDRLWLFNYLTGMPVAGVPPLMPLSSSLSSENAHIPVNDDGDESPPEEASTADVHVGMPGTSCCKTTPQPSRVNEILPAVAAAGDDERTSKATIIYKPTAVKVSPAAANNNKLELELTQVEKSRSQSSTTSSACTHISPNNNFPHRQADQLLPPSAGFGGSSTSFQPTSSFSHHHYQQQQQRNISTNCCCVPSSKHNSCYDGATTNIAPPCCSLSSSFPTTATTTATKVSSTPSAALASTTITASSPPHFSPTAGMAAATMQAVLAAILRGGS